MKKVVVLLAVMMIMVSGFAPATSVLAEDAVTGEGEHALNDQLDDATGSDQGGDTSSGADESGTPEGESTDPDNPYDDNTSTPGNGDADSDEAPGAKDQGDSDGSPGSGGESREGTESDESTESGIDTTASAGILSFNDKYVPLPTYDLGTGTLTVEFTLDAGFSASAGQQFVIDYDPWMLDVEALPAPLAVPAVPGLVVDVDPDEGEIVFTFGDAVAPLEASITTSVSLAADVQFEACRPSVDPYPQEAWLWIGTPDTWGSVVVAGPDCPASLEPAITSVYYNSRTGQLGIEMYFVATPVAGQQLTLTYEQTRLFVEPGPYEIFAFSLDTLEPFVIGTATASNGLITIDIIDANYPANAGSEFAANVEPIAWLQDDSCSTTDALTEVPGGELVFVSNNGEHFRGSYSGFICNLEGPSIVGDWGTDGLGNPVIHWTIDTGDLAGYTEFDVYSYIGGELEYDCDSRDVTPVYGDFDIVSDSCSDDYFWYDLDPNSDEPFRAIVTVTSLVNPEQVFLSTASCVDVRVYGIGDGGENGPELASSEASNGRGGRACYEMFTAPGGDVLTKTVDKTEALPGETLTYTVKVTTSTDAWAVIDLSDNLPAGFSIDPASIVCSVEPVIYQTEPCFILSDTTLRVQVRAIMSDGEGYPEPVTDPVTISLSYSGEVTGSPGTTIDNQACSVRTFMPFGGEGPGISAMQVEGDQSIIGGGRLCMTTSTLILQPDGGNGEGGETPTPTSTPTPTVPATPVVPADPEPTKPITGLPETGRAGSSSGVQAVFMVALAATMLMAVVGIRLRSDT